MKAEVVPSIPFIGFMRAAEVVVMVKTLRCLPDIQSMKPVIRMDLPGEVARDIAAAARLRDRILEAVRDFSVDITWSDGGEGEVLGGYEG